ncbi:MAG TPA: class I SAM-dependent methyltransferase [Polyangiaceae bacterium]|nr:class I SAM-dependent methyltransferase [Polyangiaceae bacterium]
MCAAVVLGRTGYLATRGWFNSLIESASVDARAEPIPWITYPCLRVLESRARQDMEVFEYGSGFSTLWWAKRVRHVVSCEHDRSWYERIRALVPANVEMIHATRDEHRYSATILGYTNRFDIVVIDGRDRVRCAQNAVQALKPEGVIVWDNSDREYYQAGFDLLARQGFRRIDFFGMAPMVPFECATAVFYRDRNCLGM